jgi:hypothetical protein
LNDFPEYCERTILSISGIVVEVGHIPDLDKGLVFLQERELLVTGNYWNLVIDVELMVPNRLPIHRAQI